MHLRPLRPEAMIRDDLTCAIRRSPVAAASVDVPGWLRRSGSIVTQLDTQTASEWLEGGRPLGCHCPVRHPRQRRPAPRQRRRLKTLVLALTPARCRATHSKPAVTSTVAVITPSPNPPSWKIRRSHGRHVHPGLAEALTVACGQLVARRDGCDPTVGPDRCAPIGDEGLPRQLTPRPETPGGLSHRWSP